MKYKTLNQRIKQIFKNLIIFVILGGAFVHAQPYTAPKIMELFGKQYTLAYQNENENLSWYEYTANNESVENWSSLITIKYYKFKMDPKQFLTATKDGLNKLSPKPHYSLYEQGDNGYALLIFEPSREHLHFEADVQKSFHISNCDGTIELQYGIRKPVFKDQSDEEYKQTLQELYQKLELDAEKMGQNQWTPSCN